MFGVRKRFQIVSKTSKTSSLSIFGFRYDVWMIQDLPTLQNREIIEIVKIAATFAWFHAV